MTATRLELWRALGTIVAREHARAPHEAERWDAGRELAALGFNAPSWNAGKAIGGRVSLLSLTLSAAEARALLKVGGSAWSDVAEAKIAPAAIEAMFDQASKVNGDRSKGLNRARELADLVERVLGARPDGRLGARSSQPKWDCAACTSTADATPSLHVCVGAWKRGDIDDAYFVAKAFGAALGASGDDGLHRIGRLLKHGMGATGLARKIGRSRSGRFTVVLAPAWLADLADAKAGACRCRDALAAAHSTLEEVRQTGRLEGEWVSERCVAFLWWKVKREAEPGWAGQELRDVLKLRNEFVAEAARHPRGQRGWIVEGKRGERSKAFWSLAAHEWRRDR